MATGMHMDERSIDCLVLGHHDQDRLVSAKSVTMRAMTLCKNLSGYRELLLKGCKMYIVWPAHGHRTYYMHSNLTFNPFRPTLFSTKFDIMKFG